MVWVFLQEGDRSIRYISDVRRQISVGFPKIRTGVVNHRTVERPDW